MGRRCAAFSIGFAVVFVSAMSVAFAGPRAVVELFTSQGCSSCPTADRLLGDLAQDSSVIAMSLPIDYWDYLGWKDTLALPRHALRQRGYAQMRGDREVYTPQVVVNGTVQLLGSDRAAIATAVAGNRNHKSMLTLPVTATAANDRLNVTVAAADEQAAGEVWVCPLTRAVAVEIGRGENKGRTVTYHNVVRRWVKLGEWKGGAQTFSVPLSDLGANVDSAAVIVQTGTAERPGPMLGAAVTALH